MRVCITAVGEPRELIGRILDSFAYPAPCIVGVRTRIVSRSRPRVSRVGNFVVVRHGEEVLVYPRSVFDEAVSRFRETGRLLLAGVPGTGKSQLAKLLAMMEGRGYEIVTPDKILSKWVGDSEKRLAALIAEASRKGMVLILDEGDWLLGARRMTADESHAVVERNLVNILLTRLQEDRGLRVIVTTNMPSEYFDPALLRAGRLGEPLYIPPPTPEAVKVLGEELGAPYDRIEEAVRLLSYTTSYSDIVVFLKKGVRPRGVKRHKGYTVIFVERKSRELLHKALIPEPYPAAVAIAAVKLPGPLVVVENLHYLSDALAVAEQLGGSIYTYYAPPDAYQQLIASKTPAAVTLPPTPDAKEHLTVATIARLNTADRQAVIGAAREIYGCEVRGRTAEEIRNQIVRCYASHR